MRQQTQVVNAMRAHLGEFGIVASKGIHDVVRLIAACDGADLPAPARKALNLLADQLVDTQKKIEALTADIRADSRANDRRNACNPSPVSGRSPPAHLSPRCPTSPISIQAAICPLGSD